MAIHRSGFVFCGLLTLASCRREPSFVQPPGDFARPPGPDAPGEPGCPQTVIDPDGRTVCAAAFDGGFAVVAHPCPADLPLPGARPGPVRTIHMIEPHFGFHCAGITARIDSPAALERFLTDTPADCRAHAEAALRDVDLDRWEIEVETGEDDDGVLAWLEGPDAVHLVRGDSACRGVEPMPVLVAHVRPRTQKPVQEHRCPSRPCRAP
jgi:hypothetical protein